MPQQRTQNNYKTMNNRSWLHHVLRLSLFQAAILGTNNVQHVQADSSLGFSYSDVTGCSDSVIEMDSLDFDCGSNDQSGNPTCLTGSEVTVTGTFTSTLPVPDQVNAQIKVCKFWGNLCTSALVDQDIRFCDVLGISPASDGNEGDYDADYYCAPAGTYDFKTQFVLPTSSLADNFAVTGVSFRIYILLNNEINCHAEFKTVRGTASTSSGYEMSYGILGVAAVLLSIFSLQEVQKRRSVGEPRANTTNNNNNKQKKTRFAKLDLRQQEEMIMEGVQMTSSSSSSSASFSSGSLSGSLAGSSYSTSSSPYAAPSVQSARRSHVDFVDFTAMDDEYVTL